MIKDELIKKTIDISQIDIKINSSTTTTITAKSTPNAKYKGEVIVTYSLDTRKDLKIELPENKRNLTTIETNGQDLTEQMIESKLPTSIQNEVDI